MNLSALTAIITYKLFLFLNFCFGECPFDRIPAKESYFRLGKTRFVAHATNKNKPLLAKQLSDTHRYICQPFLPKGDGSYIRTASFLDKISTNAIIARHLERLVEKQNVTTYTFWIYAKAASSAEVDYIWYNQFANKTYKRIEYGNFFYRAPRKIGYTKTDANRQKQFIDESKEEELEKVHAANFTVHHNDRCIAFAIPFKNNPNLGWQTGWAERHCNDLLPALCEFNPEKHQCDQYNTLNPHVLSEDKEYYYTEGNWIFANRRYVMSWKPREKKHAMKYCSDMGMKLISPTPDKDMCLVPYLKLWGMVLSNYHFWTDYKMDMNRFVFLDAKGNVIQHGAKKAYHYNPTVTGRATAVKADIASVSFLWTYELKNETRCKEIECKWQYYMLVPVSDYLKIGTICQPLVEDNTKVCDFPLEWNNDFTKALVPTAVVEFGYQGSGYWRSTYKQYFGSRICGHPDRQMIGMDNSYWTVDIRNVMYRYDYLETYWVVDEDHFKHVGKHEPLCTVSTVTEVMTKIQVGRNTVDNYTYTQEYKKVNCDEWHFYLCELVF